MRNTICDICHVDTGGGSHYHCARCGEVSSMLGHYTTLDGKSSWSRDWANRVGVKTPWVGFTCDPNNEKEQPVEWDDYV